MSGPDPQDFSARRGCVRGPVLLLALAIKDAAERFAVREKARKEGIWPPKGGQPGQTLVQENMLVVPAAFSPLH